MSGLQDHLVRVEPVDVEDPLSHFAGTLTKHGAVPVSSEGGDGARVHGAGSKRHLQGIVHADEVADRDHPRSTKARGLLRKMTPLDLQTPPEQAAAALVEGHVRALPVVEGADFVGLVTERSLLTLGEIRDDQRPIETLASKPFTIEADATIGHARAVMRENRIGRLPVLDGSGRLSGLLEWPHLVFVETRHDDQQRLLGEGRTPTSRLTVTTAMDTKPLTVGTKEPIADVARRMSEHERSSVVLIEESVPVGIVTCGDLLEGVAARVASEAGDAGEGIYVQITGLDGVDAFDRSTLDRLVKENLQRFFHAVKDPESLYLHVKNYKEAGSSRQKWSIRARLADGKGTVNSRAHGYDLPEAVDVSMERLGRIVIEGRVQRREYQRAESSRHARKQGA